MAISVVESTIRRSAFAVKPRPPPIVMPFRCAVMCFGNWATIRSSRYSTSKKCSQGPLSLTVFDSSRTSAPALKPRVPSPRSTTSRTESSWAHDVRISLAAWSISRLRELMALGRLSVRVATPSSRVVTRRSVMRTAYEVCVWFSPSCPGWCGQKRPCWDRHPGGWGDDRADGEQRWMHATGPFRRFLAAERYF